MGAVHSSKVVELVWIKDVHWTSIRGTATGSSLQKVCHHHYSEAKGLAFGLHHAIAHLLPLRRLAYSTGSTSTQPSGHAGWGDADFSLVGHNEGELQASDGRSLCRSFITGNQTC